MVAQMSRFQRKALVSILFMGITAGLGCASSGSAVNESSTSLVEGSISEPQTVLLSDVRVERIGNTSTVTLVGASDALYSAFERYEPRALVLDLENVEIGVNSEPLPVFDGIVDQVTLIPTSVSGAGTRVEIALGVDADYQVESTDGGLTLTLLRRAAPSEDVAVEDALSESPLLEDASEQVDVATLQETVPAPVIQPATTLKGVNVTPTDGGALLEILADGTIESISSFTLDDPDRLVLDLEGLTTEASSSEIEVASNQVQRVRIGKHSDKVRIVIDGGVDASGFEGRRVMPAPMGMLVTVGSGSALEEALAQARSAATTVVAATPEATEDDSMALEEVEVAEEAETSSAALEIAEATQAEEASIELADSAAESVEVSEPVEVSETVELAENADSADATADVAVVEATEAVETVEHAGATSTQVYGVHYDSQATRERIVVLSDKLVEYEVHTPDADTVVVSMKGAGISPEAEGRIAPRPGGPISLIRAFAQPEMDTPEVRLVVTRAPNLEPMVTQEGSLLFVDFAQEGVAAAPPAFSNEGEALAAAPEASEMELAVANMPSDPMALVADEIGEAQPIETGAESAEVVELGMIEAPAAIAPTPIQSVAMPTPAAVASPASLEPPAAVEILEEGGLVDGKEYNGRRISLDFKDVDVADVLRLIAEVSDLNVISGDEVRGQVTIRMVDVPWDQALDVILLTKGLGFVRVGNVLRIAPSDVLKDEEELRLTERRAKEKLEDLLVKLVPVNYATVADMSALVKRLLTARGTVNTDERTNTLIIKDIESVINEAVALVKAIDTQTPQVVIEAKIVEANLNFSRDLGIAWGVGANTVGTPFGGTPRPRTDLGGEDFRFTGANSVATSQLVGATNGFLGQLGALILDEQLKIDLIVSAAESNGSGKVISSPRVVTLDNREASIEQGVSIPFQTFENGDAKLEFIDAVLSLNVTPHITSDDSIIMELEVTRNAPDSTVATGTGAPAIARNEAHTEALVRDAQTLVIGGIYTITRTQSSLRVPYLHRIPVIGSAFKNRVVRDERKELLIFVTPRIIKNSGADVS